MTASPAHDPETLRKKLWLRAWRRGTREADLLIGRFADAALPGMDAASLASFAEFLEEEDALIFDWLMGRAEPPAPRAGILAALRAQALPGR